MRQGNLVHKLELVMITTETMVKQGTRVYPLVRYHRDIYNFSLNTKKLIRDYNINNNLYYYTYVGESHTAAGWRVVLFPMSINDFEGFICGDYAIK